ncbi:MAG: glycosyltransferase family 2 protein [Actinomycetota bacterium]|nr:glycosyltransferase family 2 protein [Actinomycetota bacterium]
MNADARPVVDDVTVVVPTVGGPLLEGCLDSLVSGTVWPARLIVVDQGRTVAGAACVAALRDRGVEAVHLPSDQTGISAATNRGLEQVRTSYAAVTHDDCRVRPDWLERLTGHLRVVGDAIVTGRVEPEGEGIVLTVKTDEERTVYTTPLLDGDVLFPPNMGFAVRLLERIGWFDEHPSLATAGEDNEWAHRALRSGVSIVYEPTVVVGHLARHRPEDLPHLYRRYARGQGAFYGTWLRRGDGFVARRAARDLLRAPWLLVRGLAARNRELIAMGRGEVVGLLPGILAGLRNRGVRSSATRHGVG